MMRDYAPMLQSGKSNCMCEGEQLKRDMGRPEIKREETRTDAAIAGVFTRFSSSEI
jgi:hypothetical protein